MKPKYSQYRRFGKRLFDLALAVPGTVVVAPVLGIIALLVRLKLGCPVLFRQERPGVHGMPFTIYKFRTMTDYASIKYRNEETLLADQKDSQAHYRNVILPDKLNLSQQYTGKISFKTDLKIILTTIKAILNPDVISFS